MYIALTTATSAQVSLQADGRVHYNIQSYLGFKTTETQGHKIQINLSGQNIQIPGWSIRMKLNSPFLSNVANVSGQPFPPEKIKFRFTEEQFNGHIVPPAPSLASIGVPLSSIPFNGPGVETPLITRSSVPLQTGAGHYLSLIYYFAIDVEGGSYLSGMLSDNGGNPWNSLPALYHSSVTFLLYNASNQEVANFTLPIHLQVHRPLGDDPANGPSYGIEVTGAARSGTLHIQNPSNYVHGASVTYPDGLKVSSQTAFEVQVKSLSPDLGSQVGYTLPISVVGVSVSPGSVQTISTVATPVNLSTTYQTILHSGNSSTQGNFFNIRYYTGGNDQRLINAPSGLYTATLIYQINPK
jgi:hypothetical protein